MSRGLINSVVDHGTRNAEAWTTGTLFLPVSPTLDDVCWRGTANLFACFGEFVLTAWGDVFLSFLGCARATLFVQLDGFLGLLFWAGVPPH